MRAMAEIKFLISIDFRIPNKNYLSTLTNLLDRYKIEKKFKESQGGMGLNFLLDYVKSWIFCLKTL